MNLIPVPALILLQLIPFLLTSVALYYILFKPMLAYLAEREENISGAKDKAVSLTKNTHDHIQKIQDETKAIRLEITAKRSEARSEFMKEYNTALHDARAEVEATIQTEAEKIHSDQSMAREELKSSAREIANLIATQTLGRTIS